MCDNPIYHFTAEECIAISLACWHNVNCCNAPCPLWRIEMSLQTKWENLSDDILCCTENSNVISPNTNVLFHFSNRLSVCFTTENFNRITIRYARLCSTFERVVQRSRRHDVIWYVSKHMKSSIMKSYGRHGVLVNSWNLPFSRYLYK